MKKVIIFCILSGLNLMAYDIKIPTYKETEFEASKIKTNINDFDANFIRFKGESTLNYTLNHKDCQGISINIPFTDKDFKTLDRLFSYYKIHYKLYSSERKNIITITIYILNKNFRATWALFKLAAKADLMPLIEWKSGKQF